MDQNAWVCFNNDGLKPFTNRYSIWEGSDGICIGGIFTTKVCIYIKGLRIVARARLSITFYKFADNRLFDSHLESDCSARCVSNLDVVSNGSIYEGNSAMVALNNKKSNNNRY